MKEIYKETLVPLDLSDAIAMIDRQKEQIAALTAYKENNYDPNESIRLTAEIMKQKEQIADLTAENKHLRVRLRTHSGIETDKEEALRGGEER